MRGVVHLGQRLEAGDTVFRLSAGKQLNIELQATRANAIRLRVGDRLRAPDCEVDGRISAIGTQEYYAKHAFAVNGLYMTAKL